MSETIASTTVFSLSAEPPAALAEGIAGGAAFDAAWLTDDAARHPCHLARFGPVGATLCVSAAMEPGTAFLLELQNGQAIPGHIGWSTDTEAGFVFAKPTDVVSTLARNLALLSAERRRVPRVELRHAVGVRHGNQFEIAHTRDLSQGGVGIETRLDLARDDIVQIAFDGLRPLDGTVRWTAGRAAGIAFETALDWQTLMPWLRETQRAGAWRAQLPRALDSEHGYLARDKAAIRLDRPARVRTGTRWWNVRVGRLTAERVEFDTGAEFAPGTQLWLWVPGTNGWPASVVQVHHGHYLAEFRLPLRKHDLDQLLPARTG